MNTMNTDSMTRHSDATGYQFKAWYLTRNEGGALVKTGTTFRIEATSHREAAASFMLQMECDEPDQWATQCERTGKVQSWTHWSEEERAEAEGTPWWGTQVDDPADLLARLFLPGDEVVAVRDNRGAHEGDRGRIVRGHPAVVTVLWDTVEEPREFCGPAWEVENYLAHRVEFPEDHAIDMMNQLLARMRETR